MGDYLKEAYLLAEINKNIDHEYAKLYDRLHDLQLSHNRKKNALIKIRSFCDADFISSELVLKIIDDALWSDGRVYYKPKKKITMRDVKRKKKGGNNAVEIVT